MRRTPPVVVHLQPQPAVQALVSWIAALASAGLVAWLLSLQTVAWPAVMVASLAVPLVAWWAWRAAAVLPRRLRWDGEAWWLDEPGRDDGPPVQLAVLVDLDAWLLLRASPGPRWLPLSRRQHHTQWTALRATLFCAPRAPR